MLFGSTNGHRIKLYGCIGRSNRMWNTFPSIQDKTRTGVNLHTSFILLLSSRKINEAKRGKRRTVVKIDIRVPIVSAPTKLCIMKWLSIPTLKKRNIIGTSISGINEPTIKPGKFNRLLSFENPHATG